VRLLSAKTDPLISNYDPHVTTIVTEETFLDQQQDPEMNLLGEWMPDQPYTTERMSRTVVGIDQIHDLLTITPAQFRARGNRSGDLRLYNQLVFEVTYLDPRNASPAAAADTSPPLIEDINIALGSSATNIRTAPLALKLSANVSDTGAGITDVSVTYAVDGQQWQQRALSFNPATGLYELNITPGGNGQFIAIVEARDAAGNATTETAKGDLVSLTETYLPLILR
jgi:hypothetical protein